MTKSITWILLETHGFQYNHMNEFRQSYFFVVYVLTYNLRNPLKLAEVFSKDGMSFLASCQNLVPRPWVIDDLEAFKVKWFKNSWKKASFLCINRHNINMNCWIFVLLSYFLHWHCCNLSPSSLQVIIFVDNSGADIILGILPFARELLRRGSQVCQYFISLFYNWKIHYDEENKLQQDWRIKTR